MPSSMPVAALLSTCSFTARASSRCEAGACRTRRDHPAGARECPEGPCRGGRSADGAHHARHQEAHRAQPGDRRGDHDRGQAGERRCPSPAVGKGKGGASVGAEGAAAACGGERTRPAITASYLGGAPFDPGAFDVLSGVGASSLAQRASLAVQRTPRKLPTTQGSLRVVSALTVSMVRADRVTVSLTRRRLPVCAMSDALEPVERPG